MRRTFSLLILASLVAACAAPPPAAAPASGAAPGLDASLANLTVRDLQSASADAKAHDDKLAALCYDFLAGQVLKNSGAPSNAVVGPISAFQRLRDLQSAVSAGLSQDFQLNCAPLLSDAQANLVKLGALGAGAAASGGALP